MPRRSTPAESTEAKAMQSADGDSVARFEQDLQELESIVARMEQGELALEESLRLFERGTALARGCRKSLDTAELKVRTLLDEPGERDGD